LLFLPLQIAIYEKKRYLLGGKFANWVYVKLSIGFYIPQIAGENGKKTAS
jgi:hypothetical protein